MTNNILVSTYSMIQKISSKCNYFSSQDNFSWTPEIVVIFNLQQSRALHVFRDGQCHQSNHSRPTIQFLGTSRPESWRFRLGGNALEHGDQWCSGKESGGEDEPAEGSIVTQLLCKGRTSGKLNTNRGHETKHSESAIDCLRARSGESEDVAEVSAGLEDRNQNLKNCRRIDSSAAGGGYVLHTPEVYCPVQAFLYIRLAILITINLDISFHWPSLRREAQRRREVPPGSWGFGEEW